MKIIFCDTNKLYGLFLRRIQGKGLDKSTLYLLAQVHEVYISDVVLDELINAVRENHGIFGTPEQVLSFKGYFGLHIIQSHPLQKKYLQYVFDPDDAQILQDAISVQADILLTNNLKDYKRVEIQNDFSIKIVNSL